jgi:hypothetical protein
VLLPKESLRECPSAKGIPLGVVKTFYTFQVD